MKPWLEAVERFMTMVETANTSMMAAEKRALEAEMKAEQLRQELDEMKGRDSGAGSLGDDNANNTSSTFIDPY